MRMAEEGGGKGDVKGGRASTKGDVGVCRDFLRNVCTRGDRWVTHIGLVAKINGLCESWNKTMHE